MCEETDREGRGLEKEMDLCSPLVYHSQRAVCSPFLFY